MIFLALPLLLGAVDLATATDCPSGDEVAAELARLAPGPATPFPHDQDQPHLSAEIRWVGEGLSIALRTPQGELAAERTLARSGSCSDMATASAVVIAAWEGEMRADLGPELPRSAAGATPLVDPTISATSRPAGLMAAYARPWEVGVGVVASRDRDVAPGLLIDAQLGLRQSRLAGRVAVVATRAHALALGPSPGQSQWSRAALELGLRDRVWLGGGALDGHVDLGLALIRLAGAGFQQDYSRIDFDFGVAAGIRCAWPGARVAPFIALDAASWPSRRVVTAQGTGAEARLPQFELRAAAGLSFGRFR